ncbi:MAG: penicillin acylase family protein [Mucilaginibacter sp.]|uniref:penicillin acylase family protein n=1 Tax=Mucilaginibacter sp. TaxID=1882438 RepID=UPI0034E3E95C
MKNLLVAFLLLPVFSNAQKFTPKEIARFQAEAKSVTIMRDNWDVPHIYAKTDASVVFGLMYAQCEENFKGIELQTFYRSDRNVLGRKV